MFAPSWTSGNFTLVAEALSLLSLSRAWAAVLFSLVLALEVAASVLFWRAALERSAILHPFFAAIGLFCAFLVFDEVLLVYRRFPNLETGHFVILCALLLSLVLVQLLAGREP